jgi:hypothetical protein
MSRFRINVGLKKISDAKMPAPSILVLPSISLQSEKGIIIWLLRSTVAITSSQPFWGGSASTLARRSAEEEFSSINLSPFAH